jgi:biopolymer transport protein ExbD
MKFLPRKHETEEINMAPLIDMVFLLLIFFAVSTSFVKDLELTLQRPAAQSGAVASTKSLRIYVDRNGSIFLDQQPVKSWMLQSLVRDAMSGSTSRTVLIIADRLTTTEKLVEIVDQAKLAGATDVGVATEVK